MKDPASTTAADGELSVDDVMADVRAGVRARLREELARTEPGSPLLAGDIFDDAEAVYRRVLERPRPRELPVLLLDEVDWELSTSLRFSSHRRFTGQLITFAKQRVVLPLTRWLYEFSRDNFERQSTVNETLMAAIQTLVIEVATLRREVAALRATPPSSSMCPPERS